MLARRIWQYVLSFGEVKWPPRVHYEHPNPDLGHKDDEGILLHFILDGELCHRLRNQTYRACRNDAVLLDLKQSVRYSNDSSKPVRFCWFLVDGKDMAEIFAELNAGEQPLFRNVNRSRMTSIFRALVSVLEREPQGSEAKISAHVAGLLAELFSVRAPLPILGLANRSMHLSEPVRKTLAHIARDHDRQWLVKELSQLAGISMYHFFRMFQRETGYSLIQYLNRYRIEQARMLLSSSKIAIQDVAREVGIPNAEHFSKLFRQINGVSPRKFRSKLTQRQRV